MNETDAELVEVYSAAHLAEAHFLRGLLEDSGIKARVVGESLTGLIPPGEVTAPRVWVFQSDADRAREVLSGFERVHNKPHAEDDAPPAGGWRCPACGETVEIGFEVCWNCETARPLSP